MTRRKQGPHTSTLGFRTTTIVATVFAVATIAFVTIAHTAPAHAAPTTAPTSSAGSVGIRLVDVPEDALNDPRALQYIVDHLNPGMTIERRIEVSNSTSAPLTVQVYAGAADITAGGFVGQAAGSQNDLSSWTSLAEGQVTIPAGGKVLDTVTVAIPSDAAPGEQYGAVWVETAATNSGPIAAINRVGIRMYVSIGGDNPPPTSFVVDTLTASRSADGNAVVSAQLHNTGGRAIDASGSLTLTSTTGSINAGPYDATLGTTIAPGDTEPVTIEITDDVAAGPWLARIEVTSGTLTEVFEAEVTFPDSGVGEAVPVDNEGMPIWLLVLSGSLVLVLIGGSTALILHLRNKNAATARTPRPGRDP